MALRTSLGRVGRPLLGVAVFVGVLVIWEVWARHAGSFLVPPASEVLDRAWHIWPTKDFLANVAASLSRLAVGFAIGAGVGIAIGLLMGSSLATRRALDPLVELARATPPIAIVPALIVVLGVGQGMQIAVIAFGVCFPVLVNTVEGVRAVSPEARDTASMLHVGRAERVYRIYLPAALPSIAPGCALRSRSASSSSSSPSSSVRVTGSGATSGLCEASSSTPRCTRRSSSSACSDTR